MATTTGAPVGGASASASSSGLGVSTSSSSSSSTTVSFAAASRRQRRRMVCSSLAVVPPTTDVATLTSRLYSSSVRGAERLRERDLYCRRADDVHPYTLENEGADNSFAPIRRARLANRLVVRTSSETDDDDVGGARDGIPGERLGRSATTMRLAAPARPRREQDPYSLQTLLEVPLLVDEVRRAPMESDSKQVLEIVGALGWTPAHSIVRIGHRFILRQGSDAEGAVHLEILLYQLYAPTSTNGDKEAASLQPLSKSTYILQAVSSTLMPLVSKGTNNGKTRNQQETGDIDASTLTERVIRDMRAIHDDLRGLVVFKADE